jgi:hypothetical protein
MGLFRSRRKKSRGTAAADLHQDQTITAQADPGAARREVAAEQRPNPDQPGWGRALGQELGRARESRAGQD